MATMNTKTKSSPKRNNFHSQSTQPRSQSTQPRSQSTQPGSQSTQPGSQSTQPRSQSTQPRSQSTQLRRKRVIFAFPAPEAQNVSLVGDFNNWDYTKTMKKDKDGIWRARIDLEPGKYEYRYLVDGEWKNDPNCDSLQPNLYGTYNCILEVAR